MGCIASLTGATDLANSLVHVGMRVMLIVDLATEDCESEADAVVVALKSRTIRQRIQ